ncbi:DNA/RNA helicase domain-containing protein [Prevotella sp.]|uniref:DNA/RNA helicase domain-containing protein n=1 Tax=Prevotella sp. TaxID=59823 RepID=UPI0030781808
MSDEVRRSFRAEKVSLFVHQLLNLQKEEASSTLKEFINYPIVLTRSLDKAKKWLKSHARGSERYGILASSKAERLKAISINVRYQPDFVHWFLEDDSDIRSSNALEDTLTEFKVQGLEIDWACVAWDADLRLNNDHTKWQHYQLRSGTKWQNINKPINREYQINAYRVLLTRARQGMVLVVPNGDYGVPPDETRKPEWYDGIYNYLKDIGIKEI